MLLDILLFADGGKVVQDRVVFVAYTLSQVQDFLVKSVYSFLILVTIRLTYFDKLGNSRIFCFAGLFKFFCERVDFIMETLDKLFLSFLARWTQTKVADFFKMCLFALNHLLSQFLNFNGVCLIQCRSLFGLIFTDLAELISRFKLFAFLLRSQTLQLLDVSSLTTTECFIKALDLTFVVLLLLGYSIQMILFSLSQSSLQLTHLLCMTLILLCDLAGMSSLDGLQPIGVLVLLCL